jgi:hypothetical protein
MMSKEFTTVSIERHLNSAESDWIRKSKFAGLHSIASTANSLYAPLNIRITLVWADTWRAENPIEVTEDADKTLRDFLVYRKSLLAEHPHDNAHLLTYICLFYQTQIPINYFLAMSDLVQSLAKLTKYKLWYIVYLCSIILLHF